MNSEMRNNLPKVEQEKMEILFDIEEKFETGQISLEQARQLMNEKVGKIRPYHIAYIEQTLKQTDEDECFRVDMKRAMMVLEGFMDYSRPSLPATHPLMRYYQENDAMRKVLLAVEDLVQYPLIKNQWLELYDELKQYVTHFVRKQNQLYPLLEKKGFDRPTTTMWTFDDMVRDEIRDNRRLLEADKDDEFLVRQQRLLDIARDLMDKEEKILYPTAEAMITAEEFEDMKNGDREIGFAFITVADEAKQPATAPHSIAHDGFAGDLQALLAKYGYATSAGTPLDVATGKLTLEQINLIYKHMPVDLSFVDENELVCFYSDTDHRVFPRSKNVIGRMVENCHPRKSVHVVREIIDKFRSGEQERAEFWLNKPGLFIYIVYVAVRDGEGRFRGVLEMMQDCTHIRSLVGSQTLLTWSGQEQEQIVETELQQNAVEESKSAINVNVEDITPETRLKDLLKQYPSLKKRLPEIAPEFKIREFGIRKVL